MNRTPIVPPTGTSIADEAGRATACDSLRHVFASHASNSKKPINLEQDRISPV